jgi:predicted TIM-barrel fold metal-dependent hydrolase
MDFKIIDPMGHQTLYGNWLGNPLNCSFSSLSSDLKSSPFYKAFAIGMHDLDAYDHKSFILECSKFENLIPIAGFNTNLDFEHLENEMKYIKTLGFKGIKIHPRFSKFDYNSDILAQIFEYAQNYKLVVFYCTYSHCRAPHYPEKDTFYTIVKALNKCPKVKLILVHGGDVSILKYAELTRFNANVLLDLSMTLMKYKGSSIDQDLSFLFKNFDRKITIGTDYPEYNHFDVYERVEFFCKGLLQEKIDNICYKNIENLLGETLVTN